jgi:hypothetical protein
MYSEAKFNNPGSNQYLSIPQTGWKSWELGLVLPCQVNLYGWKVDMAPTLKSFTPVNFCSNIRKNILWGCIDIDEVKINNLG